MTKCEHAEDNELPRKIPSQFTCQKHGIEMLSITNEATAYWLLKHINSHL